MYADRVETVTRRSAKERLNRNLLTDSSRQRNLAGKRQRQDDKWEHDLYEDDKPQLSNRKVTAQDLRRKLQKKGLHPRAQTGKSSVPVVRDLRERLSGTITQQPKNYDPPKPKDVAVKSRSAEAPAVHTTGPANPTSKKFPQKAGESVDEFLKSLGLEKYLLSFQAEEVDMTALGHMSDGDLKGMGIPMGPRKKILSALESKG